ncbi:MAG: hypothetical protein IJ783_00025 [Kiritimatiellae bacterium]|nr:hypothetical protein [Kiritimatiellia bacterium]
MKLNSRGRQASLLAPTAALTGLVALLATGCATPQKYANHRDLYAQGLYKESIADFEAEMAKRQKKAGQDENGEALPVPGSRDYALDDIEMGAGYRALVDLDSSNEAFERAEQGIREQQEASLVGAAAGQVSAVFANDNVLPYQVQEYDGIMVNAYKAVNLLQQGETDKARVEFKRVEERQRMAAERFKEQIAKAKEAEAKEPSADVAADAGSDGEAEEDGGIKAKIKALIAAKFKEAKDTALGALQEGDNKSKLVEYEETFSADTWGAQEAFTNPFATYMHGVFLFAFGEDKSDAESAVHLFETACRVEPDPAKNPAAKAISLATDDANGKLKKSAKDKTVFVVFENGLGPERQEYTIPLIIPLNMELNSDAKFVDATLKLPKLVTRPEAFPCLSVCDNGAELAKTATVCNMDAVVASEFRERMPAILLRNVLQTGVKGVLQVLIVNELGKQGIPRIAASAAVSALFNLTKAADTRIWASLPKNFQVAVVERPDSGYLQLMAPGAPEPIGTAKIPEGGPAIVFVHTPAAAVPATVSVVSAAKTK